MRALKPTLAALLVVLAFGGGYLLRDRRAPAGPGAAGTPGGRQVLYYVDPMHPTYRSDRPGIAPDCGMALEPVYADPAAAGTATDGRRVLFFRDPEAPDYTSTTAGRNPATGNTLEAVFAATPSATAHAGAIRIPLDRQQLAGVTYALVEPTDVGRTLRTVGKVTYDETRVQHVHARVAGWIEKVMVDFTGQLVAKGQPMLTIYSPEMLASQEELLLARRAREVMQSSPLGTGAQQGDALLQAARRRLQLWNLTDAQIDQVLATGQPLRDVTLHAPAAGFVLARNAFANQRVTPDTDLYTLADLSAVWVMADVYEADLSDIRTGAPARILLPSSKGPVTIAATATYVQPAVDATTRTLKVRLEARNPGMRLRPEMFVDVEFPLAGSRRLTVPADAILNSGERQVIFVDLGEGYLLPRTVQIGDRVGDRVVVLAGVEAGERVVASGTFLIDAESRLTSALGTMSGSQGVEPAAGGGTGRGRARAPS